MKKKRAKRVGSTTDIPETDFSHGVRGKHAAALKSGGYTNRVQKADGSFEERRVPAARHENLIKLATHVFDDLTRDEIDEIERIARRSKNEWQHKRKS